MNHRLPRLATIRHRRQADLRLLGTSPAKPTDSIGKLGRGQERYYLDKVAEGAEDYYSGEGEAEGYWLGDGARDAKTEAGVRVVLVSPDLAEVIVEHLDRLRRAGMPTDPDDYLVPNTRGGRITRQRVAKIVSAAAKLASERLRAKGLAPLPRTTPHTLRRTYISIALVANNFDVKWDQVGHSDSTMMDVYAQLQRRMDRQHGKSFDRLVRKAKKQLAGITATRGLTVA